MKKIQQILWQVALVWCLTAGLPESVVIAQEQLNVSITVKNNLNVDRINEPVTGGIPIPAASKIYSTELLNIVDQNGMTVDSQFVVTARWGGSAGDTSRPVKWVLATFPARSAPKKTAQYFLQSGAENTTQTDLGIVSDTAEAMTIHTGKAQFVINKNHFSLFDSVTVDGQTITNSSGNGFSLIDDQGAVYSSFNGPPLSITVKETGPVRMVLQIEGGLSNTQGDIFLDYTAFVYLYAEKSYARVLFTLGNHRQAMVRQDGSGYDVYDYYGQNSVTFEEAGCHIQLSVTGANLNYLYPSATSLQNGIANSIAIYQDSSGTDYWNRYGAEDQPRTNSYSLFRGYQVTNAQQKIDEGDQFSGWFDISDDVKGISVGMVDFWQNFPKALNASADGTISLKLFPGEYQGKYNFRVGEEKTTELFFYFHNGAAVDSNAAQVAQALSCPMTAFASTDWCIESNALQKFAQEPVSLEDRFGQINIDDDAVKYAYYNDRALIADPLYTGPDSDYFPYDTLWINSPGHPASIDYFNFYGWAWWGNQPLDFEAYGDGKAGPFNVKYQFDFGAWLQFLRTGDDRWKDMAEAFTKHLELIMLNNVTTQYDTTRWRNAVFGMEAHMETGNENGDRNRLGPVMDTCFGAPGALLHYYLTGYPRSEQFLTRVGDYAYDFYSTTRRYEASAYLADSLYSDGTRVLGNLLTALNEAFRYSGNMKYQQLAQDIMDWFAPEKQPWINGPVAGNDEYIAPIFLMLYINAMAEHAQLLEEYPDQSAKCNLAKARVVAFVDWLLTYGSFTYDGWLSSWYHYNLNGNNPYYSDMINNWMLEFADACAYAYAFTGDLNYLNAGAAFFHTGVNNPFYENSALTYSDTKEAVNHAVFGHVYLYYKKFIDDLLPPDNDPPTISILTPSDHETIQGSVHMTVDASDDVGIQKVCYSINGTMLATVWLAPYDYTFDTAQFDNNEYVLTAKAYDLSGKEGESQPVIILVENTIDRTPPTIEIITPEPGAVLSGTFSFDTSAGDDQGIKDVEFYIDGKITATVTSPPYVIIVDANQLAAGDHQLSAIAHDLSGNAGTSGVVSVTVERNQPALGVIQISGSGIYIVGDLITFDGSGSHDPDGDMLTYTWTFGDESSPSTGPIAVHAYQTEGEYPATLCVSDGKSDTTAQKTIRVFPSGTISSIVLQQGAPYTASGTIYQGASDAYIMRLSEASDGNFGAKNVLTNYNGLQNDYCSVVRFDLSDIDLPENARLVSAVLALTPRVKETTDVYLSPLQKTWREGTGTWANTHDGVSWYTTDGAGQWGTPGGDYDHTTDYGFGANGIAAKAVAENQVDAFDITGLVEGWLSKNTDNYGMILYIPETRAYTEVEYFSKEDAETAKRPKLTITYLVPDQPPSDPNFIQNPEADQELQFWNTQHSTAYVSEESGNHFFVLDSGNLYQDIAIDQIPEVGSGTLTVTISAKMKADADGADQGNPYLKGYLFGAKQNPNKINTYMSTAVVKGSDWKVQTATYPVPQYTNRIRIFLTTSNIKKAKTTSENAYFDSISVTIQRADGSLIYQ